LKEVQMDPIMPLTAGALCVNGGLPRDESVALTAAALVIPGALALAPALIAVERHRQANDQSGGDAPAAAAAEDKPPPKVVGPALVLVPDVIGKTEEEARKILEDAKFRVLVGYNVSDAANDKKVIVQNPAASPNRVAEGSPVKLQVGAKPEAPAISEDQKAIADLKADVDGKLDRMYTAITDLVAELKASRAATEALLKQKG
jgi:PASTA domain